MRLRQSVGISLTPKAEILPVYIYIYICLGYIYSMCIFIYTKGRIKGQSYITTKNTRSLNYDGNLGPRALLHCSIGGTN